MTEAGPLSALDRSRLAEALSLAEGSIGLSEPNPRVGCVIGFDDGRVVGRGFTQEAGGPHAEVMALRDAARQGAHVGGATVWVTLEPCAHHGRTPPCCDALVAAGVGRVVVATSDPFPQVSGRGLARLRAAGIRVDLADGAIQAAARELNVGFFSRMERGRPWVRVKTAISLDGRSALPDGRSQWITGEAARVDTHRWRHRAGAIVTGVGTVLADNPRLDVRHVPARRQPVRVILDRRWRTPVDAKVLAEPSQVLIVGSTIEPRRRLALEAAGARTACLPPELDDRRALEHVLSLLSGLSVNEMHVEAGPTLNGAWLQAGLVDELLIYAAPMLMGDGRPLAYLPPIGSLDAALRFRISDTALIGEDLRLRLIPAGG